LLVCAAAPALIADDFAPFTIVWRHIVTATIPNVTKVVVFEESICHAEIIGDHIQFEGLARGDTPAFIWQGDKQNTVVIHVVEEEEKPGNPSLQRREEGKSNGLLATNVQQSSQSSRLRQLLLSNHLDWNEQTGAGRLHLQIQGETGPSLQTTSAAYNIRTASVQYIAAHYALTLLDSTVDVSGGIRNQTTPYLSSSMMLLRGASLQTKLAGGALNLFAGATLPPRFLYYGGTRDIAGVSWQSAFAGRFRYSTTAAFTSVPIRSAAGLFTRTSSVYAIAAVEAQPTKALQLEAVAGISNRGGLVQGAISYATQSVTAFATATYSASSFPLNQLRLLPSGHLTASAGANILITPKLSATLFLQDTTTENGPVLNAQGATQHLNPSVSYLLTAKNRLTLNYVFDRTTGTLQSTNRSTGNRLDAEWSSQFHDSFNHTLRVTQGILSDPFETNSRDDFSIHESVNWRPRRESNIQGLSFLFSYNRSNPSIAAKLIQDLELLSPELQQAYYLDPAGFLQQQNLPPALLSLLNNLRPSSFSFEFDGQFSVGSKLNFAMSLNYLRAVESVFAHSYAPTFGFNANYALTQRTSLHATLTNSFLFASVPGDLTRASVFSFGLNQTLYGLPRWIAGVAGSRGTILGRVFRDTDENGVFHAGKGGFSGLHIVLSNGAETYTDAEGRYRFEKLPLAEYTVRLPFAQFAKPVRLTTPADRKIDLRLFRTAQSDFGVIDFSRVQGSVYNDYLGGGFREPDAPGIADVRILLSNGKREWEQVCDASGEFEFNNVDPGAYQLSIDPATIPDNYQLGKLTGGEVVVQSAHTVTMDIPLVALRSIQGVVLHTVKGHDQPEPVPGVQVRAGEKSAITTKEGSFLLRDLPSGDMLLVIVPVTPLPPGKQAPSGTIHLSRGPMEGRGIRIVISDGEMLRYLTPEPR
jgi:hypothetical protein